ncbi:integral membrane protein [Streptomyces albus]|uniref:PepSY-associated TM helix domain-containing protein n=1 Tax=Streptomyces physcomitrii TaxID=2724184 RepID=UPI000F0C3624|nr:integral membrane protein [Streptomyces albus]
MSTAKTPSTAKPTGGRNRPTGRGTGSTGSTGRSWTGARALLVRLHFYAGVLVAPFLLVAALTGLAYTATPQLDRLVYGDQLTVARAEGPTRPLAEQIAAARIAHPEGTLDSVVTPPGPEDTTRVVLNLPELGEKQRTVYVDPYTAEVRGALTTWAGYTPLTTWLDDLHRNLHLGETGRLYSETAASWLWVVVAGGLLLWLGRVRRGAQRAGASESARAATSAPASPAAHAPDSAPAPGPAREAQSPRTAESPRAAESPRTVKPPRTAKPPRAAHPLRSALLWDRGARGVRRTRSLHAVTGVWLSLGLLFLSATGLTWSAYAGARFDTLQQNTSAAAPVLDTTLPGSGAGGGATGHGEHAGHGAAKPKGAAPDPGHFEAVLARARAAGLGGTVTVTPPAEPGGAWTVAQRDNTWPVHYDQVAVDAERSEITDRTRWADYPVLAKLSKLGVQGHMGALFGLANQLVLAALALALTLVVLWGYRMWWQRRPTRRGGAGGLAKPARLGRAPVRGAWRRVPLPVLLAGLPLAALVGWAVPVLGVTLLGFLVLDAAVGLARRARAETAEPARDLPEPPPPVAETEDEPEAVAAVRD